MLRVKTRRTRLCRIQRSVETVTALELKAQLVFTTETQSYFGIRLRERVA